MFQKPFRVKSNAAVKGSERRKTRALIEAQWNITTGTSSEILPNKEEVSIARVITNSGNIVNVHLVAKNPVIIEDHGVLYPTVSLLWKYPDILPRVRTWEAVYHKLCGGADLMLPGVILSGPPTLVNLHNIKKHQPVAIHADGNAAPVAVAYSTMNATEMIQSGMRGKGFVVVHTAVDELFRFAKDKPRMPLLAEEVLEDKESSDEGHPENSQEQDLEQDCEETKPVKDQEGDGKEELSCAALKLDDDGDNSLAGLVADILLGNSTETIDSIDTPPDATLPVPLQDPNENNESLMDDKLEFYACIAARFQLKAIDFPISTQNFYKTMQASCPIGDALDFRKSTFKKPLKFFQEVQLKGLIKLREETKGVWFITEVDKASSFLREMDLKKFPFLRNSLDDLDENGDFQSPVVKEMLSINASVLPLFKSAGFTKGSGISGQEMRRVITDYVRVNELTHPVDKSKVMMSPELADVVLEKGENQIVELPWTKLFQRLAKKMGECYSLEYSDRPAVLKKGGLPPVVLNVESRSGNKKVTLVCNLETFGIDPRDLAKEVRVRAATSSSVSSAPGQKSGQQVLIQGNQVNLVVELLVEKYKVEKRHIRGAEKGEKKKKR